jgi:hypothetical protein
VPRTSSAAWFAIGVGGVPVAMNLIVGTMDGSGRWNLQAPYDGPGFGGLKLKTVVFTAGIGGAWMSNAASIVLQ